MARARDEGEGHWAHGRERAELLGELLRYVLVCGLLLVFVPPLGWLVAFFWGIRLARRALEASGTDGPRRREREELARERRRRRDADEKWRLRPEELRIEALLDRAIAARADRIAGSQVELSRETDPPGALRGDPALLARALDELLDRALDDLSRKDGPRRLALEVGESLAGSEVWLRIRGAGDARTLEERAERAPRLELRFPRQVAEAHGGRLDASASPEGAPEGGFELLLTLPKGIPAEAALDAGPVAEDR